MANKPILSTVLGLLLHYGIVGLCLAAFWQPWLVIPASLMSLCFTLDTILKRMVEEENDGE